MKEPVRQPQVSTFFEMDYILELIASPGSFQYFMKIYTRSSWNHLENINWSRSGSELRVLSKAQKPQKWWKRRKFTYFTQFKWVKWLKIGSIALKPTTHILYWLINLKRSKFKSKQAKWVLTIYWKLWLVNRPFKIVSLVCYLCTPCVCCVRCVWWIWDERLHLEVPFGW